MRGLIIGKFCPPHKGHSLLIETGLAESDSLTVLVCASQSDPVPATLRLEWLRQLHPAAKYLVIRPDDFDRSDAHAWVRATLEAIGTAPDIIFSSEEYGLLYAELLGCAHRMVDKERVAVPVSASDILADPIAHSRHLDPLVLRHFTG